MAHSKKDHIALPAQTLRRFREAGKDNFFYIDVKSGVIGNKGPSSYQRQRGYYQESYDADVRKLEDMLAKVSDKIATILEEDQDAQYDREWLKHFVISLIAMQTHRRPELKDAAMETDRLNNLINAVETSMFKSGIINNEAINRTNKLRKMFDSEKTMRDFFYERTDMSLPNIVEKLGLRKLGATFIKVPKGFQTTFLLTPYHYFKAGKA